MESKNVLICVLLWYTFSIFHTVVDQRFFVNYPCPLTISLSHMLINSFGLAAAARVSGEKQFFVPIGFVTPIVGLAFFKFLVSCSSHYSALLLPVPLMEALKSLSPIVVVIATRIVYGTTYSHRVMVSILIMISGVLAATLTQTQIVYEGLFSSLLLVISSQSKNLVLKHSYQTIPLHPFAILSNIHFIGFLIVLPFWIVVDLPFLMTSKHLFQNPKEFAMTFLVQGFLSTVTHLLKAIILSNISSLTYSVVENGKSLSKTVLGFVMYQRPTGLINLFGTFLAVIGVFYYTKVKAEDYKESKEKKD